MHFTFYHSSLNIGYLLNKVSIWHLLFTFTINGKFGMREQLGVQHNVLFLESKYTVHSALIRTLIKLKGTAKLTTQGEPVCLKDSKYILFEILAHRTWKGRTSSCRPSQLHLAYSASRSLYSPSMSHLLGFQTKYIWNP